MPIRRAVASYARISQDRDGSQTGVRRQLSDCRELAASLGWTVAEEYVDDDVSAYSGRPRPGHQRMLDDLADGRIDAIIAGHIDRLYRRPSELEHLLEVCERVGVTDLRTVAGAFELGTGDGMLVARLLSAVAANESDSKRRRGKRKMLEMAEQGLPHGGGTPPIRLPARPHHPRPDRVRCDRQLTERALAGESLPSLSRWHDANGIRTVKGKPWRTPTLRGLLLNPRICGQRVHNGQVLGPAVWEPIISPERGEALRRLLTAPERRTNRSARTYLLSGLCRCSKCGTRMVSGNRDGGRKYLCRSGVDSGGCARMTIAAERTEAVVSEMVLHRLDSPELHDALAGRVRDDAAASARHD